MLRFDGNCITCDCSCVQSYRRCVKSPEAQNVSLPTQLLLHKVQPNELETAVLLCTQFIGIFIEHKFKVKTQNTNYYLSGTGEYKIKNPLQNQLP